MSESPRGLENIWDSGKKDGIALLVLGIEIELAINEVSFFK